MNIYECIVVGAGVEGSAAAYKLAESGLKTLLLEQFELCHSNGSSHGGSRIVRNTHAELCFQKYTDEIYIEWKTVEEKCGQSFFVKTGLLTFGRKVCTPVETITDNFRRNNVTAYKQINGEQLAKYLPQTVFQQSDDYYGILDELAGVHLADKALKSLQELVVKYGGEIRERCQVVDIRPNTDYIELLTGDCGTQFKTKKLVLCPGSWAGHLAKKLDLELPLTLIRCFVTYWKEKVPGTYSTNNGMPCFLDKTEDIFGIPSLEKPGYVKLMSHGGYEFTVDYPNAHDDKTPFKLAETCEYVQKHFPGLESTPSTIEKCKYTMTPDYHFIIDKHPKYSNIIIATGFCGTGFKMAPIVGNILRDLVLNVTPKYNIEKYKIDRFI